MKTKQLSTLGYRFRERLEDIISNVNKATIVKISVLCGNYFSMAKNHHEDT